MISGLWLEAYVDESVDRGDNCHPGTITRFGMLIIFLRFFHNFPALKAIRFLIKVYQVVLQPVQRQSLREVNNGSYLNFFQLLQKLSFKLHFLA